MKRPCVSLATLCVIVAVVAVDLAWLRHIAELRGAVLGYEGDYRGVHDLVALMTLNMLAYGLRRLTTRGLKYPFWAGFVVASVAGIAVHEWCYRMIDMRFDEWFEDRLMWSDPVFGLAYNEIICCATVIVAPMLLFASACGVGARFVCSRPSSGRKQEVDDQGNHRDSEEE